MMMAEALEEIPQAEVNSVAIRRLHLKRFSEKEIFMTRTLREKSKSGHALMVVMTILLIAVIAGASYLKRAMDSNSQINNSSKFHLLTSRAGAEADTIRSRFASAIDVQMSTKQNTELGSWMKTFAATMESQIPDSVVRFSCSSRCDLNRQNDPKRIHLTLSLKSKENGVVVNVNQAFEIRRTTLSNYAWLVLGISEDLNIGNTTFNGPVGFNILGSTPTPKININGNVSFNGPLLTNVSGLNEYISSSPNSDLTLSGVTEGAELSKVTSAADEAFKNLAVKPGVFLNNAEASSATVYLGSTTDPCAIKVTESLPWPVYIKPTFTGTFFNTVSDGAKRY